MKRSFPLQLINIVNRRHFCKSALWVVHMCNSRRRRKWDCSRLSYSHHQLRQKRHVFILPFVQLGKWVARFISLLWHFTCRRQSGRSPLSFNLLGDLFQILTFLLTRWHKIIFAVCYSQILYTGSQYHRLLENDWISHVMDLKLWRAHITF